MPSKTAKQTRHHPCVRCGLWEKNSQNAGSNRAKKLHRFQHWLTRGIDLPVEWYEWCNIRCTLLVPEKGAPLLLRKMEHHPNNGLHSKIKYYVLNYYWLARNGSLILFPIPPAFMSPPFPSSFSPSLTPPPLPSLNQHWQAAPAFYLNGTAVMTITKIKIIIIIIII